MRIEVECTVETLYFVLVIQMGLEDLNIIFLAILIT